MQIAKKWLTPQKHDVNYLQDVNDYYIFENRFIQSNMIIKN